MSLRTSPPTFFRALPPYLGGKRRLAPLITALLAEVIPPGDWRGTRLLDPMCGGGALALYAKAHGFDVLASDIAQRGAVVARALIANSGLRLTERDVVQLLRADPNAAPRAGQYTPNVFTPAQAAALDGAIAFAQRASGARRSLLELLVIKLALRCQPMSTLAATDAAAAGRADFDQISPRRLGHYLRAEQLFTPENVWRIAQDINRGVFAGHGTATRGDALELISTNPCDVLYLDPPYAGTTGYQHEYAPLDVLLGDEERLSGATPTIEALLDAAAEVPLLVLSYGGPTVTLESLVHRVTERRRVLRAVEIPYPRLRALSTKEQIDASREYIVVAER